MSCYVSRQCDSRARQLSTEQLMDEASELYMDEIRRDYGPRLDELAAALADHISEDDLNGCLALYRMENPGAKRPREPKIDPKHRLTVSNLFRHRATQLAGKFASATLCKDIDLAAVWVRDFNELHAACRDLFGARDAESLKFLYDETFAAELQLLHKKEKTTNEH